ncbi:Vesicle transport protein S20 [Basidiobolus ranarum]|uniref:Vesicle transport protein S20 n=1 Tax=Basidiobolus ranarum TaxID=34480 RepID=A0ABR2WMK1_9FUNG
MEATEIQRLYDQLDKSELEIERLLTKLNNSNSVFENQQLSQEIRDKFRLFGKAIERIRLISDEQDKEEERRNMLSKLERHEEHQKQLQVAIRKTILTAKQNIERQTRLEREYLLKDAHKASELRQRNMRNNDGVLRTATDVTDSLRRTTQLMSQEIERSAYSAKVLDDSSKMLRSTHNEYRGFNSVMRASKQLITKLEQSDWTDRLLILFGLLVFMLVVLYILKKRLWIPGLGLGMSGLNWGWTRIYDAFTNPDALKQVQEVITTSALSAGTPSLLPTVTIAETTSTLLL